MINTRVYQHLDIALSSINNAIRNLQAVGLAQGNLSEEANYYAACLREIVSSDNGEAGLESVVKMAKENQE